MSADPLERQFLAARALHEQGDLGEADRLYRNILDVDGGYLLALLHLGMIRLQQGRPEEAAELFRTAAEREPNSAEARSNLATALQVLGRMDEAVAAYEDALAVDPSLAEAYYGLASALQILERGDEAIALYERALVLDPDYAEAYCGLGGAYHARERYAQAIACYEKALDIDPDYPEALYGLAGSLYGEKRFGEAAARYRRFLELDPDHAEAYRALGATLQALDRYEEALSSYEKALALDPSLAGAQAGLGSALQEMGRIEEARRAFASAVALDPGNPRHHLLLVESKRVAAGDPELAALEEMERSAALAADGRMHLHFALAKALSDVGDNEESFRHYLEANALKRGLQDYDEAAALAAFDEIRTVFSAELMSSRGGGGDPSDLPVFIVGMPRSGSTLVEQILASHPKVFGGGERVDFSQTLRGIGLDLPSAPFSRGVPSLTREDFGKLGAAYVDRMREVAAAGGGGAIRITDKTLNNFFCVGLIRLALPNARIVHTVRDPVDTCLSCFTRLFGSKLAFTYDLAELGRYHRAYQGLMRHWSEVLPDGAILDVRYEDVVDDLEGQARRLVAYCGLDWDEACLAFHETKRPIKTASVQQVRQPLYRSSVERWRPADEILRPLLEGLDADGR